MEVIMVEVVEVDGLMIQELQEARLIED